MAIGEKLAAELKRQNKKPGTLARETGISKNTIYGIIKRDNEKVEFSTMEKIAQNLGLPVEFFFNSQPDSTAYHTMKLSDLTEREAEFIRMFRELDEEGKARVENAICFEYDRRRNKEKIVSEAG